ncbi:hypothetical protein FOJ82_14150 [Tessaracoccus rhinocerotis]|uniref:Uncharacterized protein n=1 Tax=Tessaracoccus rhinocerotis TaxID=1689449 RepID=A0A553JX22_9ACTN|nr:hypothetical protein [Tessaracoccus rhinocerotis]TRY16995.1 hypothetical protein FOJ82_14150 [Tessaracoccus rhinocerotis]
MLLKSVLGAVFWTGAVFISATGLLRQPNGDVIEPTAVWAGIVGGLMAGIWGFLQVDLQRPGGGLRTDGLPSLLALGVPVSAVIQLAGVMLWPFVIDGPYGSLVTQLHSEPIAVVQVALFLLGTMAWSMTPMFCFASGRMVLGLLSGVLFLVVLGLGLWQGFVLFHSPVEPGRTLLWAVVAALGFAVMTAGAVVFAKAAE